jgi:flagellin-like hook-associated protein FlgL
MGSIVHHLLEEHHSIARSVNSIDHIGGDAKSVPITRPQNSGTLFAYTISMARITFSTMYDTTMRYLQRNGSQLNKLDERIASEQMINRPSDDAVGFTNAMKYRNIINSLGQQQINMNDGEIYMTILETSHQNMNNVYTRSRELAVQAASDTQNHDTRLFINMEIRQNLEQLVAVAQTKHKDGYIFSGKWTNQPPYEIKRGLVDFYTPQPNNTNNQNANELANNLPSLNTGYTGLPNETVFDPDQSITFQLYDNNYMDNNIRPHPDNPMAQRIIPGSFQLEGLVEKPYKNTDLPEDHPDYDKPDYEVNYVTGEITLLSDRAKARFYDVDGGGTVTVKPTDELPKMEFEYIYRNSIDMSGEIYREIDSGITIKINSNPDDMFGKGGASDTDSFKEIIALMQGLWYNDQPQINKSIETIDTARKRNLAEQDITGSRLNRVALSFDRNKELNIANHDAQARIEGVDLAETLSQFALSEAIYNASLQAAARLMQKSLMDYL